MTYEDSCNLPINEILVYEKSINRMVVVCPRCNTDCVEDGESVPTTYGEVARTRFDCSCSYVFYLVAENYKGTKHIGATTSPDGDGG